MSIEDLFVIITIQIIKYSYKHDVAKNPWAPVFSSLYLSQITSNDFKSYYRINPIMQHKY